VRAQRTLSECRGLRVARTPALIARPSCRRAAQATVLRVDLLRLAPRARSSVSSLSIGCSDLCSDTDRCGMSARCSRSRQRARPRAHRGGHCRGWARRVNRSRPIADRRGFPRERRSRAGRSLRRGAAA
jgi:hypothetical protein